MRGAGCWVRGVRGEGRVGSIRLDPACFASPHVRHMTHAGGWTCTCGGAAALDTEPPPLCVGFYVLRFCSLVPCPAGRR